MSLADRMRLAADTLTEVSTLFGYPNPEFAPWAATELITEAQHLEENQ